MRQNRNSPYYWMPLLGILILLCATGLGYVPVPGAGGAITLLHIPVILAGVLSGPFAGMFLGLIFGLSNCYDYEPHDYMVQVIPRIAAGLISSMAYWSAKYYATRETKVSVGALMATVSGTVTNSLGVTLLACAKGLFPLQEMIGVAALHGFIEVIIALVVILPITVSVHHWRTIQKN